MGNHERELTEQPRTDDQPRPVPRKKVESPQEFYRRIMQRPDVRWLMKKLAER